MLESNPAMDCETVAPLPCKNAACVPSGVVGMLNPEPHRMLPICQGEQEQAYAGVR